MTEDMMALRGLMEKSADADLLREIIGFAAQRLMDLEVTAKTGTAQRLPRARLGDPGRNGGTAHPELRTGSYFPGFLEPRRLAEKAPAAVIQEAHVQGISTRSVDELVKAMDGSGISKSQVSRLCEEIDERSRPSSPARSRATGRICGSTPPM